jgi:hypothetical protein
LTAHLRAVGASVREVAEYGVYRQAVLFFGLVDHVVRDMWAGVPTKPDQVTLQVIRILPKTFQYMKIRGLE